MWGCLMKCSQERKAEEGWETSEPLRQLLLPKGWSGILILLSHGGAF